MSVLLDLLVYGIALVVAGVGLEHLVHGGE